MTPEQIRPYRISEVPPLTALQTALLQAGTPILDADDVRAWQEDKLKQEKARAKALCFRLRVALVLLPACAAALLAGGLMARFWVHGYSQTLAWIGVALGMALARIAWRLEVDSAADMMAWRPYTVAYVVGTGLDYNPVYAEAAFLSAGLQTPTVVPPEAVALMRAIAATGVEASFRVEQLDADPFLYVRDYREGYYIAVWDERGYIR